MGVINNFPILTALLDEVDVSTANWVIDEDDLVSNDATKVPTQQSVKTYVDNNAGSGAVNAHEGSATPHSQYAELSGAVFTGDIEQPSSAEFIQKSGSDRQFSIITDGTQTIFRRTDHAGVPVSNFFQFQHATGAMTAGVTSQWDFTTGAAVSVPAPTLDAHAATKLYVDNASTPPVIATEEAGLTYTLVAADDGASIVFSNAALVTVTIPTDAADDLADGYRTMLVSTGSAGLQVDTTGITLLGSQANPTIAQNESIYLEKTADPNTWIVIGGGLEINTVLTELKTVDGAGSGLDADLLDGFEAADLQEKFEPVTTVATSGATEDLDVSSAQFFDVTMDQNCTFTFSNPPSAGSAATIVLILRGAFTATWPGSVAWSGAVEPPYTSPSMYTFTTVDGGTTWFGTQSGEGFA